MRPLMLDLFCCQGGAAKGYHDAGFEVVGIDIEPQPLYPYEFIQDDALAWLDLQLRLDGWARHRGRPVHAVHASPPCQAFSLASLWQGKDARADKYPDLVDPTRKLLEASGLPYIIENVEGAPLRRDLVLCGEMFGLRVHRHRLFEIGGWFAMQPRHAPHRLKGALNNCHIEEGYTRQVAGNYADHEDASDAMGIDWMDRKGLAQAIPPAYTRFIGEQLLTQLDTGGRV